MATAPRREAKESTARRRESRFEAERRRRAQKRPRRLDEKHKRARRVDERAVFEPAGAGGPENGHGASTGSKNEHGA